MRVTWTIEDGYANRGRNHEVHIPDDEVAECSSQKELEALIYDYVQVEFDNRISWAIVNIDDD